MKPDVLLTNLRFGESPRWHDGRLWFADWGAQEIVAVDPDGTQRGRHCTSRRFPFSIDWLPDGRMLIVSSRAAAAAAQRAGRLARDARRSEPAFANGWNEIVVDGRGNTYVNGAGFDLMAGEAVRARGSSRW